MTGSTQVAKIHSSKPFRAGECRLALPASSKQLANFVDSKLIKPSIAKTYVGLNTTNIQNAFDDITSRRVQGKIIIQVVPPDDEKEC